MRTKRIVMFIEVCIFILGIVISYYFGLTDNYDLKLSSLISNIFIGISTGGIVAFLTTIPSYINERKIIKSYLFENSRLLYIYVYQLSHLIDDALEHSDKSVNVNMFNKLSDSICEKVDKLYIVDSTLFICKTKFKQLKLFNQKMYDIVLIKFQTINQFKLEVLLKQQGLNDVETLELKLTNNLFAKEFVGIKAEMQEVLDLLDNTIKVVYDKKSIQNWELIKKNLKETILNSTLFD